MTRRTDMSRSILFATSRTRVLNLRARWSWIRPIVQMPRIRKLLHRCLRQYMQIRKREYVRKHAKPGHDSRKLFRYSTKRPPYSYTRGDFWCDHRIPAPDSVGWFQAYGACHWLAEWAVQVAPIHMPHLTWDIRESALHSTVVGYEKSGEIRWIFDILFFEEFSARQILDWTRKVNPVAPKLRSRRRAASRRSLSA